MKLTPNKIYMNYLKRNYNKSYAVDLLTILINKSDNTFIRAECIEKLNKLNIKSKKLFHLLENLVISDSSEIIRQAAAKVLRKRFLFESFKIFAWVLYQDPSISCKIIILKALEKINNCDTKEILIEEINAIKEEKFRESIKIMQANGDLNKISCERLVSILINYYTITYIYKKLNTIYYKLENGLVVELDLRDLYKTEEAWRYKDNIIKVSNFEGIKYLKDIKKLRCLSLENAVKNDYRYYCEVTLLKVLKRIENENSKRFLLFQLNKIHDDVFQRELSLLKLKSKIKYLESIPNSILADILINYLTLLYFIRRYKNLRFEVKNGYVTKMELKRVKLIKIPEFICNFNALKVLKLNFCNIYELPLSIGSLKLLEVLSLKGNNLNTIPKTVKKLCFLNKLNVSKNRLIEIAITFDKFCNLKYLNLSENSLTKLPDSIGCLKTLQFLDVSKNQLKNIPETLANLQFLEILNCSYNELEYLPENLGMLNCLQIFNVDNNCLLNLPQSISYLKNLRELYLAENKLSSLTDNIGSLQLLEKLDLSWNSLNFLPIKIGQLKKLKYLNLTHNNLKNLPNTIGCLFSLINLDLTWNNLKTLPQSIGNLKSLESLILYDNKLNILPESIGNLKSLKYLNLCENNLRQLPYSIKKMDKLENLNLTCNNFATIL